MLATLTAAMPAPVSAQAFLQTWQGRGSPNGHVQPQAPAFSPFGGLFSPYRPNYRFESLPPPDRTTYRTLCVRMCDGFYFPISFATTSANFTHDAEKCAASCGGDARLFYHPNPGGDVESMVDLTGRSYGSYPSAFRYRKTLVHGCQCRPQPWSDAERARHRNYAAAQQHLADDPGVDGSMQEKSDPPRVAVHQLDETPEPAPLAISPSPLAPRMQPPPVTRQRQVGEWNWFSANPPSGVARYSVPGAR